MIMAEIHLYGKLRRYAQDNQSERGNVIRVSPGFDETLDKLLARLEIPVGEIYSVFFNSKLLATRTAMASWIGYRQVRANPFDWNLNVTVLSGDRIGLFGRDMSALVV
jgi:hypothetical protein